MEKLLVTMLAMFALLLVSLLFPVFWFTFGDKTLKFTVKQNSSKNGVSFMRKSTKKIK